VPGTRFGTRHGPVDPAPPWRIQAELKIAPQIVIINYAAIVGILVLTAVLAFGLGGREVAAQILSSAYDKAGDAKDQAKGDLQTGKDRAQQVDQARNRA